MTMFAVSLPAWAIPFALGAAFAFGLGLGLLYFRDLWRTAGAFAAGGSAVGIVTSAILRLTLLGIALAGVAMTGALPLLATAAGLFVARAVAVRRVRGMPR